ncbi:hypothetical protein Tco_0606047 [Tanacetum coccineum]
MENKGDKWYKIPLWCGSVSEVAGRDYYFLGERPYLNIAESLAFEVNKARVISPSATSAVYATLPTTLTLSPTEPSWGADDEGEAQRTHRHRQFLKTRMSMSFRLKSSHYPLVSEDGPVDYPMDGGDDGDDDDGDSSRDDTNDEDEDEEDEEDEEEEHLAPADSTTVILVDEPVLPPEGTEPVIPPPSTDITIGARITVWPQTSISLPPEAEVERLLTMTTPSPSPPISLSPPSAGERLARYEIGESSTARPTRGRGIDYGFVSTVDAEERRQGIRDVGYGIRDTWVDPAEAVPEITPVTETVWMVEEEAYASREAWAHSIGLSQATHQELQTHRDHVYAHETHLQAHQTQLQLQSVRTNGRDSHEFIRDMRLRDDDVAAEFVSTARAAEES